MVQSIKMPAIQFIHFIEFSQLYISLVVFMHLLLIDGNGLGEISL